VGSGLVGLARPGEVRAQAQKTIQMPADEMIAMRKAKMDLQGGIASALKFAVDNKVTELKAFKPAGTALAASAKTIPDLFPPGTETGGDTKALPAVWTDREGLKKDADALQVAGERLAKAAEANDQAAFAAAFEEVGKACGGCHRTFRAKTQ
jgi:cytochrome c556